MHSGPPVRRANRFRTNGATAVRPSLCVDTHPSGGHSGGMVTGTWESGYESPLQPGSGTISTKHIAVTTTPHTGVRRRGQRRGGGCQTARPAAFRVDDSFGTGSPMRVEQRSSARGTGRDWSHLWCLVWTVIRACRDSAIALGRVVRMWSHEGLEWHRVSSWVGEVTGLVPALVPAPVCPPRPIPPGSVAVGPRMNGTLGHVFADSPATWRWGDRALSKHRIVTPHPLSR